MPVSKKTIQKKSSTKKTSPSKIINKKLVKDFKETYADAIVTICRYLTHSDDSSIDYHRFRGSGYLGSTGSVNSIYQGGKPNWDDEIDNANIIFSVDKKEKINSGTKAAIEKAIEEVNELVVEDFKEMMAHTDGGWYRSVNENNFYSVLDLNYEMHSSRENHWSFSFTPIDDPQGPLSGGWVPKRVKEIYAKFTDADYHHNRSIWDHYGYETEEEEEEEEEEDDVKV